jgi:UDP-2,3-diacylglucosamine pyrophosphatase LpxH
MRRIFVISDLHLGGRPTTESLATGAVRRRTQICGDYDLVISFLEWLRNLKISEERELVINGDLVDFLLEDDYAPELTGQVWLDEAGACAKLDQIAKRAAGVFKALREFLNDGHHLTILLGNHDVELSLPRVRRRLRALLGADGKRFQFLYDGEAYVFGRVLIEHGNRYDSWNITDYSGLRQERSVLSRGMPVNEDERAARYFVPPPGTYLVMQFLNRIKSNYTFVDLLKPENHLVVALLFAIEPDFKPDITEMLDTLKILKKKRKNQFKSAATPEQPKYLRAGERDDWADQVREALGEEAAQFPTSDTKLLSTGGVREWLKESLQAVVRPFETPLSLLKVIGAPERQRLDTLRNALYELNRKDRSFDLNREMPSYRDAAMETAQAGGFEVIVYGHTHLPKREILNAGERSCTYLNTGTWCHVMRLPKELAPGDPQAPVQFKAFLNALSANDYRRYIDQDPCFAEIHANADGTGQVRAELYRYSLKGPVAVR